MRALLIGNYGVANFGDEALRHYFLETFPHLDWTVVSASGYGPSVVPRLPLGFRSLFTPWWSTIRAFWRTDIVVFGGGSLFTDHESVLACFLWGVHAWLGWIFGKPLVMAFQGVGPFDTALGKGIAHWVFRQASFISVRDRASAVRLQNLKLNTEIVQSSDPVFLSYLREKINVRIQKVFVVIPRHNSNAMFEELYKSALKEHAFDEVRILSLQPHDPAEQATVRRLESLSSISCVVVPIDSQTALLGEVALAQSILVQRFHGALAALALKKEMVICPLHDGDKLATLQSLLSQPGGAERLWTEATEQAEAGERALQAFFTSRTVYAVA